MKNLLKHCKQFLPYKNNQLQHNALQELPNLRKQISLICLPSILKIYQPKDVFHFILAALYNTTNKNPKHYFTV
jgi:hypothetical protein